MEICVQCCGKCCGKEHLDAKLPYRQMAGTISVIIGLLDLLSDLIVMLYWFAKKDYFWASLMLTAIMITNIWSAYKYSAQISPRKMTIFMGLIGLLNVRILVRFWKEIDQDSHYSKLMNARFVECLLESIPCAIIQLYVIVLTDRYEEVLVIISCTISVLNLAYGLRNWYKFSVVSGESANFVAEITFDVWYIWLELFVIFDFVVRGGALALFLSIDEYRPASLVITPVALYVMEFILDLWDNKLARNEGMWMAALARAFSVALVSLGSGFMFVLFAEQRFVAKMEVFLRYLISIGLYILYNFYYSEDEKEHVGWDVVYPVSFLLSLIGIVLMHVGKSPLVKEEEEALVEYDEQDRVF